MTRMDFWNEAYRRMLERYGAELPWQVLNRFEQERFLLSDECVRMLLFLSRLQAAAHEVEAPVLLRGQYTASFAGYLLGGSEINPLPPHYYCARCRRLELVEDVRDGFDLPEKVCACGAVMTANGHDIPAESLALQAKNFNSIECAVPRSFLPVAEGEIRSTFGEAYDVVSVLVEEEADRIHYAMLPKGGGSDCRRRYLACSRRAGFRGAALCVDSGIKNRRQAAGSVAQGRGAPGDAAVLRTGKSPGVFAG